MLGLPSCVVGAMLRIVRGRPRTVAPTNFGGTFCFVGDDGNHPAGGLPSAPTKQFSTIISKLKSALIRVIRVQNIKFKSVGIRQNPDF
ncbi:MAG: hypothetical protein FWE47_04625 [Oscillospiraceae bacterium]|nr:hypothetical protein [Oscillospiraceae bacterium]